MRGIIAVAASMVFALASCDKKPSTDSASSTAKPATASSPQTPTTGVTDSEIVVGEPAAFSGPSAELGIEMWRGASAAFSAANDAGGVAGRRIKLVVADDGYDAERAAAAVIKVVEQDHAFVVFGGVGTPTIVRALPVVRKYFDDSGLFYFANFTGAQPQRRPPNAHVVFNIRASYAEETKAMVDVFVAMGRKKIGVFLQDDAYGVDGREGTAQALRAHGLDVVADARYPRGQTYDASTAKQVKILRDAGADAVVMIGSYQACGAFIRDARKAGWNVPIHDVSFVGPDAMLRLLQDEEKKGGPKLIFNLINTQVVPDYEDTSVPAVRDYRAAIDKYNPIAPAGVAAPRSSGKYGFVSLEGFVSARALLLVLQKAGHDLTRKTAYAAAENMGKFDLGVGADAELSPQRHQALDKVWFTYATPDGWKSTDSPASIIK